MSKRIVALGTLCVLVVTVATLRAQTGTIINDPNLDSWSIYGKQTNARISDAKVSGGAAIEVTLPKKGENSWDAGAVTDITQAVHKGDHIHIAVPLKGNLLDGGGNVKIDMKLQFNSPPYNTIGYGKTVTLSSDWQTFVLEATADKDYAPRSTALVIVLATDKQLVDIGPATITGESSPTVQAKATGSAAGGLPVPKAFYVAPSGRDSNPGTLEKPVATLARAQQLMRASTVKTTYIRAGVYVLPVAGPKACTFGSTDAAVGLTAEDDGETWSFYPPDGYGTAVLDGQSTKGSSGIGGGNGLGCAFAGKSIHDVHIVGLRFKRFLYSAFWTDGGAGLSFADNIVQDLTAAVWSSGGAYGHCVSNSIVRDNAFLDLAYMGVAFGAEAPCTGGISNDIVSGNVVLNTCLWPAVPGGKGNDQDGGDCGGIYILDRTTASTGVQIVNNFTRDVNIVSNAARDWDNCCAFGIYLDDGTSNTVVNGNVVAGSMTGCFMIHGGEKNDIRGNLCDLGVEGTQGIVAAGTVKLTKMSGNRFHNNLIVAGSKEPGLGFFYIGDAIEPLAVADNAYFNYAGSKVSSKGTLGSDAHPFYRDPRLSSWTYKLAKDSPIYGAPVSFTGIPTTWGPPGFVIPQSGTQPSFLRR